MKLNNKLYCPTNISLEKEWWKGFGNKEAVKTIISIAISIVIILVLTLIFKTPLMFAMIIGFCIVALTITVVQRVDNYMSINNFIKILIKYKREQQTYYYKGSVK